MLKTLAKLGPYKFDELPNDGIKRTFINEAKYREGIYSGYIDSKARKPDGIGIYISTRGRLYQG